MTIGERIKAARKKAGMTQKEVSEKLGISYQAYAQWELGTRNPKMINIEKIAKAIGCSPLYLYGLSDKEELP